RNPRRTSISTERTISIFVRTDVRRHASHLSFDVRHGCTVHGAGVDARGAGAQGERRETRRARLDVVAGEGTGERIHVGYRHESVCAFVQVEMSLVDLSWSVK